MRHSRYGDLFNLVMESAQTVIPHLEIYSIDEAFLRMKGALLSNAEEAAWAVRERVKQWTGISVSVGLAPTRTLAKLANHVAKKNTGVFTFPHDSQAQSTLLAAYLWGMCEEWAERVLQS